MRQQKWLFRAYKNEMANERVHYSLQVRRWFKLPYETKKKKINKNTTQACVNGKSAYTLENPSDSFVNVLKIADFIFNDFFVIIVFVNIRYNFFNSIYLET